jgi:hypothetical protein
MRDAVGHRSAHLNMGWKTNQQTQVNWLVEKLTIPILLDAMRRKDPASICALKTPEGIDVFKRDEAQTILERLAAPMGRAPDARWTMGSA